MAIDNARVKALFQSAVEITDPAERQAFLEREAGQDRELRDRLNALMAAYDAPPPFLDQPLGAPADLDPSATSTSRGDETEATDRPEDDKGLVDTVIADRYKLRQEIGEGGMGTVFLAEQLRPVRRMVALKLIKRGMDTRQVLARFESERQALALMEHPNIARVLDAGTTADGRPFFVMELVKGIPITQYCDLHRLDLTARLNLFRQVCQAVQHAHQKGIIHRDLKPSNILVEAHDDRPVPKIIDFGLAKATSGTRLTEQSLFTAFGSVAGTPLYMAPEQANWSALDIDTRADIYALGVILFELLTGSTPIARESIQRAAVDEMLRMIREFEPPTPSSRISISGSLASLAATRQVDPARLSRLVRGELDWIVMKALAKERERRYATAVSLAEDIEKHLNHEPVTAGPPTAGYRMRKFVRRNRVQVAAAGLLLLALMLGVVGTTIGLVMARRSALAEQAAKNEAIQQKVRAEEAATAEQQAKELAVSRQQEAERNLAFARKGNEILGSIFAGLDPRRIAESGRPLQDVLRENLVKAVKEVEGSAIGDPLEVATMQSTLGQSLLGLGEYRSAVEVFGKALGTRKARLGPDHPETLMSMMSVASSYLYAGQLDRALKLYEETLTLQKAKLGPDHPQTLRTMNNLASTCLRAGQLDRALKLYEETLTLRRSKLGPDHPETIGSMLNLASSYLRAGQVDRALKLYEEGLALMKTKLGPDHPRTLGSMSNLAVSYAQAGQNDQALKLFMETLTLQQAKLGPDHPETLRTMSNLANSYAQAGRFDRALKLREETLTLQQAKLGPDHPETLSTMSNLANSYAQAGQVERAVEPRRAGRRTGEVEAGPRPPPDARLAEHAGALPGEFRATRPGRGALRRGDCGAAKGQG